MLSNDTSGIAAAVAMAKDADEVILAVGTDLTWAREGQDAESITFTDAQQQLIDRVAAASKKPVIVVLMTATPLDLSSVLANENVGALLHVGQPSVTILGVAPLLFGERSPAGRMVQTVYPKSYADQVSIFDFGMRPGPSPFARPDCTNQNSSESPAAQTQAELTGFTERLSSHLDLDFRYEVFLQQPRDCSQHSSVTICRHYARH